MTPSTYISTCLKNLKKKDLSVSSGDAIEERIFTLLMSKKFRKYSVNTEYREHIRGAIQSSIEKDEPIKLTLVFGGYKLWRLKESPEVDWAELFSLMYYTAWLSPICALYKPGVWFDFFSDDVILEIMDNVPKTDTEAYQEGFRKLLKFITPYIPKNLMFTLNRVGEQYISYEEFTAELSESITQVTEKLGGLPTLTDEQKTLVELNVHLKPGQADDPLWREKVFLIHEGYAKISKRRPYYRTPDKIFLMTRQMKDSLAVGTTKTSVVKFWIGAGVLQKTDDTYQQYIYSPKQLDSHTFRTEKISIDGLPGKNFTSIPVLET
jgi:hypothetical protein